jgi:hypothetical protein
MIYSYYYNAAVRVISNNIVPLLSSNFLATSAFVHDCKKIFAAMTPHQAQGSSAFFRAKKNEIDLLAVAWWDEFRHKKLCKQFIATAGTSAEDPEGKKKKRMSVTGEAVELKVRMPIVTKEYSHSVRK